MPLFKPGQRKDSDDEEEEDDQQQDQGEWKGEGDDSDGEDQDEAPVTSVAVKPKAKVAFSEDNDYAHDSDDDGAAAPPIDGNAYDSDDDKVLSIGRNAQDIANERLDAKIFARAEEDAKKWSGADVDPEGLGDDFENSMWLPPTVKEAYNYRMNNVFKGGEASSFATDICSDSALSASACLYFTFVRSVAWYMFWNTLLSAPLFLMAFFGSRTSDMDKDPLYFYLFTLGNVGYDKQAANFETESACTTIVLPPSNINGTCIHLLGTEFAASDASNVLTLCEFIQGVLFLFFIRKLRKNTDVLMEEHEVNECTIRDYSIMVTEIPPNVTPTDLLVHFNKLYPLDTGEYCTATASAATASATV